MLSQCPLPFLTPKSQAITGSSHHLQTLTPPSSHHLCFIPQFHFTGHSSQLEPEAGLSLPRRGSAAPCDHIAQTCQGTQGLPWPSQPPCSPPLQKRNRRPLSSGSFGHFFWRCSSNLLFPTFIFSPWCLRKALPCRPLPKGPPVKRPPACQPLEFQDGSNSPLKLTASLPKA